MAELVYSNETSSLILMQLQITKAAVVIPADYLKLKKQKKVNTYMCTSTVESIVVIVPGILEAVPPHWRARGWINKSSMTSNRRNQGQQNKRNSVDHILALEKQLQHFKMITLWWRDTLRVDTLIQAAFAFYLKSGLPKKERIYFI